MTRAQSRAADLRRELGLRGRVDAEFVANYLGFEVVPWPFRVLQEIQVADAIGVAERLDPSWRRWMIAHAMGHSLLHPGNHVWMQEHTSFDARIELEAEEFAGALLIDKDEAMVQGLAEPRDIAEYFGVPEEMVRGLPPWNNR